MGFWESMILFEQIFFVVACIATGLLIIQLVISLLGFAGDGDIDVGDVDSDGGVGIFTVKGLVGFFAIGGWVCLACSISGLHWGWSLLIGIVAGCVAFVGVGFAYKFMSKMQSNGSVELENSIGKQAEVYLTIPASSVGRGKVNVTLQGRFTELDAMTNEDVAIKTGELVYIEKIIGDCCIVTHTPVEVKSVVQMKKKKRFFKK